MSAPARPVAPHSPDPRVERSRRAIIDAARAVLLEHGASGLTIDAVVATSGVSRATIYRHWSSRGDLLAATFESFLPVIDPPPDDLGWEERLRRLVNAMAQGLADDAFRRVFPILLGAALQADTLDGIRQRISRKQRDLLVETIGQGVVEGVLPDTVDAVEAALLVLGPLVLASLDRDRPFDHGLADRVVDQFLRASHAAQR